MAAELFQSAKNIVLTRRLVALDSQQRSDNRRAKDRKTDRNKNMISLTKLISARLKVLLVGQPALAKTARIKLSAEEADHKFIVIRLSLAERVDLAGCLVPDFADGITRQLPLAMLKYLQTTTDKVLVLLDDLGQAPTDVQAAAMSLFDAGFLSPSVLIWGATNRPADKAGCVGLCEPLRSRFDLAFSMATPDAVPSTVGPVMLSTWQDEVDGWCLWAAGKEYAAEIVAFHASTYGKSLYQWKPNADPAARMPDFRSWESVAKMWQAGIRDVDSIAAAIGKPAAIEFTAFAAMVDELPTPQQIWADPHTAMIPTSASARFLIASILARAVEGKTSRAFTIYFSRLEIHLAAFAARVAFKRLGAKLAGSAEWQQWFLKNSALFQS